MNNKTTQTTDQPPKKDYHCQICGKDCSTPQGLGSHLKGVHPEHWTPTEKTLKYRKYEVLKRKVGRPKKAVPESGQQLMDELQIKQPAPPPPFPKLRYCPECGCNLHNYIAASTL